MAQTVIGIFKSAQDAHRAVDGLMANGLSESNIDYSENTGCSYETDSSNNWQDRKANSDSTSMSGNESTYASANTGLSSSSSDIDTNEHESGIAKFFRNLFGGNDDESERYTKVAERGILVTVHAQDADEAERAADVLDEYGAIDVEEHYQQYGSNNNVNNTKDTSWVAGTQSSSFNPAPGITGVIDTDMPGLTANTNSDYNGTGINTNTDYRSNDDGSLVNSESRTIPIIEENLQVGKKEVETGGVRIRSRIVERPVEETLRLREERIRVERKAVDREASVDDIDNFEEGTIELRERSEVPVVSKDARVIEEVSLDRDVEHREETIRDTVRSTQVDVEDMERKSKNV